MEMRPHRRLPVSAVSRGVLITLFRDAGWLKLLGSTLRPTVGTPVSKETYEELFREVVS